MLNLPVSRFQLVTELANDRLKDKTVIVRRNAMILLKGCLARPQKEEEEREGADISEEEVSQSYPKHLVTPPPHSNYLRSSQVERDRQEIEHAIKILEGCVEEEQSDSEENLARQGECAAKTKALEFTSLALSLISSLESTNESLLLMLLSKSMGDVMKAKEFGLPCAVSGMRKALSPIFGNKKLIQEQVLTAFTEVFLSVPGTSGKTLLKQIAHNPIVLCGESSIEEASSSLHHLCELRFGR